MVDDVSAVVSPADARVLIGSLDTISSLFIKQKFFDYDELLGQDKKEWLAAFRNGAFMVFRLTPDKYHYNHTPIAGEVKDFYEIPGGYHSCNPGAVVSLVTAYSKNKRVVTIIDTDVPMGTGIGLVAMIEVVALMVGEVEQAYSYSRYDSPCSVTPGMFLEKGVPKSLFRPGSSTVVLLFQESRLEFADDLVRNMHRTDVQSRFSAGFGKPLVETDVKVRSRIGSAALQNSETRIKDL
jgi:phosphatidylserine decarboxylase